MRFHATPAMPLVLAGLAALIAFPDPLYGAIEPAAVAAWVDTLPIDQGALEGIARFADEERGAFGDGYASGLAAGIRRLIRTDVERQLGRLAEGARAPFIEVSSLAPGFPNAGDGPADHATERDFEGGFVRTEVLAFFPTEATPPRTALAMYTDKEFRQTISSRIKRIWSEEEEVCIELRGVKLLLGPIKCCDRIAELQLENVSAQHAQTVRNTGGGDYQSVFFKESLKTFVRLPDGLAFHYINYSRTVGMTGVQGMVGRGKIEESERKAVAELGRRLAALAPPTEP